MTAGRPIKWLLAFLLAVCIGRLWLMPLPSGFWVDEMVTAFVVRHGPADPSLAVAPQVPQSIYYVLPEAASAVFGFSEIAYRLPSILLMGLALFLTARLAARLIHPEAGWFAVFACLGLQGFNYEAADARPYALGICVAAAALTFLVRWLDSTKWSDALLFALFAALLWRVHLIFWPFYPVLAFYVLVRLIRHETAVSWLYAGAVFTLLGLALVPVLLNALPLLREAKAHVIADLPDERGFTYALKFQLILQCGVGAWLARKLFRWPANAPVPASSLALIGAWWCFPPLFLFAFSSFTGNSVFVARYLSIALPGVALLATYAASVSIPSAYWKPAAVVLSLGVLLLMGQWHTLWPPHHNSGWRTAAVKANQLGLAPDTPVIYPSPFIEAKFPVWRPDYPLPGFLYAHLPIYPIRGKAFLFPFETSPEAEQFAAELSRNTLEPSGRFLIYGGDRNVLFWRDWFARRPELAGWRNRRLGPFGDVELVMFEKTGSVSTLQN